MKKLLLGVMMLGLSATSMASECQSWSSKSVAAVTTWITFQHDMNIFDSNYEDAKNITMDSTKLAISNKQTKSGAIQLENILESL